MKTLEQEHKPPKPEITASHKLKTSREAAGHSLEDIAAMLRIRLVYLRAIEAGQYDILPAGPYVRGFLRTYANALGLDEAEVLSLYEQETGKKDETFQTKATKSQKNNQIPFIAAIVFSIILIIVIGIGWKDYQKRLEDVHQDAKTPLVLETPVQTDATAIDTGNTQISEQNESTKPASKEEGTSAIDLNQDPTDRITSQSNTTAPKQPPNSQKVVASKPPAQLVTTPLPIAAKRENVKIASPNLETTSTAPLSETSSQEENSGAVVSKTAPKLQPREQEVGKAKLTAASQPYIAGTIEIIAANAATWVRVAYANESRTLFQGIIELGRKLVVSGTQDVVLSTGNAGALEVVFADDLKAKSLGKKGEILRNSPLKSRLTPETQ